jgi:hypothetical protein
MVRIFAACHGTQLLVIQHLRHNLRLPEAREFLVWHPFDEVPRIKDFMQAVISGAGFADALDISDFESLRPRTQGSLGWWFESTRRMRRDASSLRRWMAENRIVEEDTEVWADDPIHFYVNFLRGTLRKAHHVKIPHCFNHEDGTMPQWKAQLEQQWRATSGLKNLFFLPWQRMTSGVDMRMDRVGYERAYSFDKPSPWATTREDVSNSISLEAFERTYRTLPPGTRAEVETVLEPTRSSRRPLVVLLLFGLGPGSSLRPIYERSMAKLFAAHATELKDCSLAVKVHPGARGTEEQSLIDWLKSNVPANVRPIAHPLNLEFMLPQLRPDYVMAGPCGALPIVRRLGISRPIVLADVLDEICRADPAYEWSYRGVVDGLESW